MSRPRGENLAAKKQQLLELMLEERRARKKPKGRPRPEPIPRADRSQPLLPSFAQQRLWFLDQLAPGNPGYNVPATIRLTGPLEVDVLWRGVARIVARHEDLRTNFTTRDGRPYLVIRPRLSLVVPRLDLTSLNPDEALERAQGLVPALANLPFDLERDPLLRLFLMRLADQDYALLLVTHHIISDVWSIRVFFRELAALYDAETAGEPAALPELPFQYTDYAAWQRRQLEAGELDRQLAFWKKALAGAPTVLDLPTDHPRPVEARYRGSRLWFHYRDGINKRLRKVAEEENATLYMGLLAVLNILLHRYTGQREILVGAPVSNRGRVELEILIGFFVNNLVMRTDLGGDPSFRELLGRVRQFTLEALENRDLPFERLVTELALERDTSRNPLYQVDFTLQNFPMPFLKTPELELRPFEMREGSSRFDLEFDFTEADQGLDGFIRFCTDLFSPTTVSRMIRHFGNLLAAAMADPDAPLTALSYLSPGERLQLVGEWNDTARPGPGPGGLHQLFARQVRRAPEAVAVVFESSAVSYRELNRRANRLAHHLIALGVGPEVRLAVCLERSLELVVGLLAILKAGGAYLPLDPDYPQERLSFMLADAGVEVLLTQSALESRLAPPARTRVVAIDREGFAGRRGGNPKDATRPDHLAYVIYTSGSTGKPKGVGIPHGAAVNFLASMASRPGMGPADVLLAVTTVGFDVSVLEIFLPLSVGARVLVASRETAGDGFQLSQALADRGVTVMQATPATWRLLLESRWRGQPGLKMLCGGEALPADLAARLADCGAGLWNMYGPTETTVWSAVRRVGAEERPVRIGRPIANTCLYLLDAHLEPVAEGMAGEVWIGGDGLARGYHNRPALTAERFVPDPFAERIGGGRLYRVGDLARYRPGGEMEFLGRVDHQVKIRGFRIELGEIETALEAHPAVAEAAVVVAERPAGDSRPARLQAFVVATGDAPPELGDELKSWLRQRLPEYMVPSFFLTLDALPQTASGKVDRRALSRREVAADEARAGAVRVAPQSETERRITEIWQQVLGMETLGVADNFFDLGGDSLLLAQVHSRVREAFETDLPMMELFRYPTIRSLAERLHQGEAEQEDHQEGVRRAEVRRRLRQREASSDIAIIGMALHFPDARTPEEFWRNLVAGLESVRFFSEEECLAAGADPEMLAHPQYVRAEAVVDDVELFDPFLFGLTPREAEIIDPQQRSMLELAWEALERAGYAPQTEDRTGSIAVFASTAISSYLFNNLGFYRAIDVFTDFDTRVRMLTGNDKDFCAQRISYQLKLGGPSVNVQSACSSALAAVHMGCQSLVAGECDMALAGGVQIRVPLRVGYLYQEGGLPSPDGHCRPFDVRSMGTVHSNGAAMVLLKRLPDALADRDPIHAVIKASAANNDAGTKVGFTAPSLEGITRVAAQALAISDVDPATIRFLEAHGTGTELGDALEIEALTRAFRRYTDERQFCYVGSVKSNIGHMDVATGMPSLIKAVMALENGWIPPTLHFEEPNPRIGIAATPFQVNATLEPWPQTDGDGPRRAGVNLFGIGGTNVCMVLEQAPPPEPCDPPPPWQLLALSARSTQALLRHTARLIHHLEAHPELELADVAFTLQVGRTPLRMRRTLVCRDREEALEALANPGPEGQWTGFYGAGRPVVFLLPGDLGELAELGAALCELEPEFRRHVDACQEAAGHLPAAWLRPLIPPRSPLVTRGDAPAPPHEDDLVTRVRSFAVGYALARLWMEWGIVPQALYGEGVGEVVAACLAGVFSLPDALAIVRGGEDRSPPALSPPRRSLLSPRTGDWLSPDRATDPAWWKVWAQPAPSLDPVVAELGKDSDQVLLELGSGRLLARIEDHPDYSYDQLLVAPDPDRPPLAAVLAVLGRLWAAGVDVDWPAVHGDRRRRRVELPTYPFERVRCWVEELPAAGAVTAITRRDRPREVAESFYAPTWQGRSLPGRAISGLGQGQCWLVAGDGSTLAGRIVHRLAAAGHQVVTVGTGAAFRQVGPNGWLLRPRCEEDYHALVAALGGEKLWPARVVHLWSLGAEPAREAAESAGFWSLIYLARALSRRSEGRTAEVGVVTTGLQELSGEEKLRWESASLLAPVMVLPRELPDLRSWCADVVPPPAGSRAEDRLARDLVREYGREEVVSEIVYRGGRRYVRHFDRLDLSAEETLLREDGVYLVTDGGAGFGLDFAAVLARAVRARLAWVSPAALPPRDEWEGWLEGHDEDDETSVRMRRLQALEESGSEVLCLTADLTDRERMRAVVAHCHERFGGLDGVVHAAAEDPSPALAVTEIDEPSYAARIRQRVLGAAVLEEVLRDQEPDFCLLIGSLSSLLGDGTVAETAADRCLELLARDAGRRSATLWRRIDWDPTVCPETGVAALSRLLAPDDLPHVAVCTGDLEARRRLPAPAAEQAEEGDDGRLPRPALDSLYAPPGDEMEAAICAIWEEIFGIRAIGVDDNFFELGGHSLMATQVVHRLRESFEVELLLREVMALPTVRQLALAVAEKQIAAGDAEDLEQLMARLEDMPDEEALALAEQM